MSEYTFLKKGIQVNILYIRLLSLSKISNFFVFDWEDNHVAWNYVYLMPFESYNVKNTTLSLRCIHFLVEKPPETWIYVGEVVENMGCLMVRSVGTTILNSCLKGSWLMQLVNYWEIPGKKKKKSCILNKRLSAHTIWLVYCSKVPVATHFGSACVKLRQQ